MASPSLEPQVARDAKTVYDYHRMQMPLPATTADAIFCLCSLDLRVARRAAELYLDGHGRYLIFSGGSGKLTMDRPKFRESPEAVVFARMARDMGVPLERILVESESTNTGDNVRFTHTLLAQRDLLAREDGDDEADGAMDTIRSFILVQKPYMERRTYATFMKQWPGMAATEYGSRGQFEFAVTSPQLEFHEYPDEDNPQDLVVNIMVGDLIRIREYPAKGYQIVQDIPEDVWEAGQRLVMAGFNKHLP